MEQWVDFAREARAQPVVPIVNGLANYPEHTVLLRLSLHRTSVGAEALSEVHPPLHLAETTRSTPSSRIADARSPITTSR